MELTIKHGETNGYTSGKQDAPIASPISRPCRIREDAGKVALPMSPLTNGTAIPTCE
ncbi:hypothetical protein RvY_15118 [Ramazzottius varieornatus]|uniref:Uncharacterized protein n=1 Tax=Ramazzottius varieornatus TaxID=947166 RepID=A0A1D1VTR8_RAMVA|nr:hypothetical protein RvY_15118 [Ramazzottius varieornatus]